MFSRLLNKHVSAPITTTARSLPLNVPVEEESIPGYDHKRFYHPNPGEIVDGRFELKAKLGWGTTSTVWLAQDVRWRLGQKPFVAIKFNDSRAHDKAASRHELEISKHIDSSGSTESGRRYLRTVKDSFEISGTHGSHLCLVFEPMREPIWLLRKRLGGDSVTRDFLLIFKLYIIHLLDGLDYLHTNCKVVHTDLKLDNILVTFEDISVIEKFVHAQAQEPMPRKVLDDRVVYLSHNNFGPLQLIAGTPALMKMCPKITDFGSAQRWYGEEPLISPIQADHCHAPEVLLGTGWSYSADIWNFGVMVWELLAGTPLFQMLKNDDGAYSARHHLAEMMALLGPAPPELVQRERDMRRWQWSPGVLNSKGNICNNAVDFYGGPFFDDQGEFVGNDLIHRDRSLEDIIPECIAEDEVELFLNFMREMLRWVPEERATAKALQKHPWLDLTRE